MPEIQYPKNPNSDTAFVVQEDGTKNRALMTAPQDTSTLELPKNANSCKGYVTVDGKKQRVILTADIGGGGGGESYTAGNGIDIDANNEISVTDPVLVNNATGSDSLSVLGGATAATRAIAIGKDAAVTTDYGIAIGSYLTQSEGGIALGQAAQTNSSGIAIGHNNPEAKPGVGHSSIAIGLSQKANVAGAIQIGTNPSVGTNSDANTFKVSNENGNYEIMSADGTIPAGRLTHAINKYSTMPTASASNEGQIVQFTGTTDANYTHGYIYECVSDGGNPATYSWTAVQVQAGGGGGSAVPMAAEFTSSTAPSAVATAGQNCSAMAIGPNSAAGNQWAFDTGNIAIGQGARSTSDASGGVAIGVNTKTNVTNATVIGNYCEAYGSGPVTLLGWGLHTSAGGIMIGTDVSLGSVPGTGGFDVVMFDDNNYQSVLFTLLTKAGLMPADRLASTTGLADGNYRLRLTMSSGTPTLSWVAE